MSNHLPLGLAFAMVCSISAPALAEFSGDDYAPARAITSEAERARIQALIDAARAQEAERAARREAEQAAAAARAAAAQAAALAAQPVGARLAVQYCTTCHAPEVLARARHTALGWAFTIARMRWLNGAAIPPNDAALIRAHLTRAQPARALGAVVEYGAVVLLLAGLLIALRQGLRVLARRLASR